MRQSVQRKSVAAALSFCFYFYLVFVRCAVLMAYWSVPPPALQCTAVEGAHLAQSVEWCGGRKARPQVVQWLCLVEVSLQCQYGRTGNSRAARNE